MDLHRSLQTFRAVALTGKDAKLLDVSPMSPGIFLESIIYDSKNIPVEVLHAIHRGDKYLFEVESGRYRFDLEEVKPSTYRPEGRGLIDGPPGPRLSPRLQKAGPGPAEPVKQS